MDRQLFRYREKSPNALICILQEGVILPDGKGKCLIYKYEGGKFTKSRTASYAYGAYRSYLQSRLMEGIPVIQTVDTRDTAMTLANIALNTRKTTHKGLTDYFQIKPKKRGISKIKFRYLQNLMSIEGIGEVTAQKLIGKFKTPANIYGASRARLVASIGEAKAESILQAIGRQE